MNSDAPGGRPAEVALATKCLITNLGLALFGAALVYAQLGFPRLPLRVGAWLLLGEALQFGTISKWRDTVRVAVVPFGSRLRPCQA